MAKRKKSLTKRAKALLIFGVIAVIVGLLILGTVLSEDPDVRTIRKGYWVSDGEDVDVLLSFPGSRAELFVFATDSPAVSYVGSYQMTNGAMKITDDSLLGDLTGYELYADYDLNEAGDVLSFVMYGGTDRQQNYTFTLKKTAKGDFNAMKKELNG
ncbi:MAG: hypothetical protein MJ070_08300 [Lachnospiraceae bacterium]|nr:hypothetical protein [Lachnospiraceae bacterium]